jgi:hypothetical protein
MLGPWVSFPLDVARRAVRANSYPLFRGQNVLAEADDFCYNTGDRSTGKEELA